MAVTIRVRNFQSIEDAEVEVSGLTVVTGQNNSGKTALMRSVRGVFENSGGDAFVRHGTDALAVHIDFGDADVTWSKGPKVKPTYVVGGKTINPGRAVPDEVSSLGIAPVQAGSGEVWPQIAPQFTGQVFLLDMPGSAIAEVVSDVDRVSRLTEALRYADSDKRSANADLKLRRKDRDDARSELDRFDGLDAAGDVVAGAESVLSDAVDAGRSVEGVVTLRDALRQASSRVSALHGVEGVSVPDPTHVRSASSELTVVRRIASSVTRHRASVASLSVDVSVPDVSDVVELSREVSTVRSLSAKRRAATAAVVALPTDTPVPSSSEASSVADSVADVRRVAKRLAAARASVRRYGGASVAVPDATQHAKVSAAIVALKSMSDKLATARAAVGVLERQLETTTVDRGVAQAELDAVVAELGACPTCGSEVHADGVPHRHGESSP